MSLLTGDQSSELDYDKVGIRLNFNKHTVPLTHCDSRTLLQHTELTGKLH